MASVFSEIFSNIWAMLADVFIGGFFIFIFLIFYDFIHLSEGALFFLMTVGYGIALSLNLNRIFQRRRAEAREGGESEKTIYLTYGDMFLTEAVAFFAAIGSLAIVYWSEQELTIVNIAQSVFIFSIVKFVNWYYLRKQI